MTDFEALLKALVAAEVEFIVVGGAAAIAHGSARATYDLDIVYGRASENISRLVRAIAPFQPYLRGAPPGLPFRFDEATVARGLNFTLVTAAGDLDVLGEITGGGPFEKLAAASVHLPLYGMRCLCLGLPALIAVKRAAGRPKDLEALAELEAILEEQAPPSRPK